MFNFNQSYRGGYRPPRPPRSVAVVPRGFTPNCASTRVHVLPVTMTRIADSVSDQGFPMAIFACSCRGCAWRAGYVIDAQSGRPRRLWHGQHQQ